MEGLSNNHQSRFTVWWHEQVREILGVLEKIIMVTVCRPRQLHQLIYKLWKGSTFYYFTVESNIQMCDKLIEKQTCVKEVPQCGPRSPQQLRWILLSLLLEWWTLWYFDGRCLLTSQTKHSHKISIGLKSSDWDDNSVSKEESSLCYPTL